MELRVLRYVMTVADERHFGRAAQRCHVAQSALSQQVKQLESELGVRLFDRSTRHVELTEAGVRFLDHARQVVAGSERAVADMRALSTGRAGAVRVGFIGTATYDVLPRVAHRVRSELPDVDLTLRGEGLSPTLVRQVSAGELDLALVRRPPSSPPGGVSLRALRTEPLVAVVPDTHRLATHDQLDLELLAGEPFVIHPSGDRSFMHHLVLAACRRAGFEPPTLVEVSETATLVVSVAAGQGVALVPEPVRSLRLEGVTYLDLTAPPTVELVLAAGRGGGSPAVDAVAATITRCLQRVHRTRASGALGSQDDVETRA